MNKIILIVILGEDIFLIATQAVECELYHASVVFFRILTEELKKEGPISIMHNQRLFKLCHKQSIKLLVNAQKLHDKILFERGSQGPLHHCHNKPFILKPNQNKSIFSGHKNIETILGREDLESFIKNERSESKDYKDLPRRNQELMKNVTLGIAQYHPATAKQSNMLCQGEELMVRFSE